VRETGGGKEEKPVKEKQPVWRFDWFCGFLKVVVGWLGRFILAGLVVCLCLLVFLVRRVWVVQNLEEF